MKSLFSFLAALIYLGTSYALPVNPFNSTRPLLSAQSQVSERERGLEVFEEMMETLKAAIESSPEGSVQPLYVQQVDVCASAGARWQPRCAQAVNAQSDLAAYETAVKDSYYGYKGFILIDKSVSRYSSPSRTNARQAQTMYVYKREGDQVRLVSIHAVSTGREPVPGQSDTREGYMRVQNAQENYVSRKYNEPMPRSLWFESEYGTAIHETSAAKCERIGIRASAGCVRLCDGDSNRVFNFATQFGSNSPIVLLDKRSGAPISYGSDVPVTSLNQAPKVIRGYPIFIRIIDATTDGNKQREIDEIIQNPTAGFEKYFRNFSPQAINGFGI